MPHLLDRLGLRFNPFEPAAAGVPLGGEIWLPQNWSGQLSNALDLVEGRGVKALAITGEYGSGKTYILQWLHRVEFPGRRIKAFYFDNPGVQFYDLANSLLRQIGRKDFAKSIWELAGTYVDIYQRSLFSAGFEEYLRGQPRGARQARVLADLQNAILKAGIATDEEIAHRLARIVAETPTKPYFEYRDFVAGKSDALIAEREEAPYFGAILKTLRLAAGINAVAFLVDEFEEISIQKRLNKREAHNYLATLRRLINLTQGEDLWVVVAMTLDAVEKTQRLEPAMWERFTGQGRYSFHIPPLTPADARQIVEIRTRDARPHGFSPPNTLFPFPDELEEAISPATLSNPRRLVKVCFYAVNEAVNEATDIPLPFAREYLRSVESKAYPRSEGSENT